MRRSPLTHSHVFEDEAFAADYARRHQRMAANLGARYAERLRQVGFSQGAILDAGCGFGGVATALAQAFPQSQVVGVDLSDALLTYARLSSRSTEETTAEDTGITERVRFERADVEALPYEEGAFDVVINTNMAHIVTQPVQMLDELERVLAADGCLFIADIRRTWLGLLEKAARSGFSLAEARALLDRSQVRQGRLTADLLWWRYEALPQQP
jgi:ubiquinone/menaquinone biosynthesis C-methylase UbiE